MKKVFLLLSATIAVLSSCKTDFNTIAPYKEVMVVYGLMNPNDAVQYIRISKAFLGEGNALIMAQQYDSTNYGDLLSVTMDRVLNGSVVSSHPLTRDTIHINDGIFYSAAVAYSYSYPVVMDGSIYKITIHNNVTGLTATGNSGIAKDASMDSPTPNTISINFTANGALFVKFLPGDLATDYNATFRFYYLETDSSVMPVISQAKSFDWNLGDQTAQSSSNEVTYSITRRDFFSVVAANIIASPNKWRHMADTLNLILTGVTQEVQTYINLTTPTSGITQDRPLYSNIDNGIGIFSSRNSQKHTYHHNLYINDSLIANPITSSLGFY